MKNNKMKKAKKLNTEDLNNNNLECLLIGVLIILVSAIGIINQGPVGHFLTYISVYLFGAFYFLLYLLAIGFGLFLIIKKKAPKVTINMELLGFILVFLAILISTSGTKDLKFSEFASVFNQQYMSDISSKLFVISNLRNVVIVGGGFIGFLFRSLLNTCVTYIGTIVVCVLLFAIGFGLLFKEVIAYIVKFFKNFDYKKAPVQERKKVEVPQVKEESTNIVKDEEPVLEEVEELDTTQFEPTSIIIEAEKIEINSQNAYINEVEELNAPNASFKSNSFFIDDDEDLNPAIEEPKKEVEEKQVFNPFVDEIKDEPAKEVTPEVKVVEKVVEVEKKEIVTPKEVVQNKVELEEVVTPTEKKVDSPKVEEVQKVEVKEEKVASSVVTTNVQPLVTEPVLEPKIEEKPKPKKKAPYVLPSFDLLKYHPGEDTHAENDRVAQERLLKINKTFEDFNIGAQVISYTIGPSVTRYNIKMNAGVKVNVLNGVKEDVSVALNGNKTVRVETVVEGRDTSSIEVGNEKATPVSFKECFEQIKDKTSVKDKLLIPLGKDIEGKVITTTMDALPHLLVAGTTGSGKSVFVNTIIMTWLMRNTPDELKLMLVDPKKVEFTKYKDLPHLLCPIITDAKEGNNGLKKLCEIMDKRYEQLAEQGVSKISEYNEMAEEFKFEKMSNIVVVVDEYADFLSDASIKKEIEGSVQRLCQKARACGIYLIICTQRPSVDVITGTIKAVIPSRIGLLVPTGTDSKTILDSTGAEALLGYGDMLCQLPGKSSLVRVQGSYISNIEIRNICDFIKSQREVEYDDAFINLKNQGDVALGNFQGGRRKELDPLHEEAKAHVIRTKIASTSNLQSTFGIGYGRADHILNCLEDEGVIKRSGSGNRRIVCATEASSDEE